MGQRLCNLQHCPSQLYIDSWQSHWSLRSYMFDNSRFASLWPYPEHVHSWHIEKLFEMVLLLKGLENVSLPTATAWMSLKDFRVCRCLSASQCHRWESPRDYYEDVEPYVKLSSAIFATLARAGFLWDYYTGRVPRAMHEIYKPICEIALSVAVFILCRLWKWFRKN